MQWHDKGIILSVRKYGENSGIVSLFTPSRGVHKGLVRGVSSPKNCGIYQTGNIVDANWRGRLAEQLGSFSCELQTPIAALCLRSNIRLTAMQAMCQILEVSLPEHDAHPTLYEQAETVLLHMSHDHPHWCALFSLYELELLSECGFRLDLSKCAATGVSESLTYVSPKSGRAVSQTAGKPYHDKLLPLPAFLMDRAQLAQASAIEIRQGLHLCRFFMEKYVFSHADKAVPDVRYRLEALVETLYIP
jgi:DNA repair protein RecO (recombination protein O)